MHRLRSSSSLLPLSILRQKRECQAMPASGRGSSSTDHSVEFISFVHVPIHRRPPMRHCVALCMLVLFVPSTFLASPPYDAYFTSKTMRVDYFHTGTRSTEGFSLDQVYQEGSWPGSRVNLVDTLNLGEYAFRVYDRGTGMLIYSRGYSTIFNEWQTTDEALNGHTRTFSETARFPFPRRPVQLTIVRRDKEMILHEIFSLVIDPADPTHVNKE